MCMMYEEMCFMYDVREHMCMNESRCVWMRVYVYHLWGEVYDANRVGVYDDVRVDVYDDVRVDVYEWE